ncbi:MAG: hypothetical protein RL618_2037 [Pseudomonadota bacterium]|jgi:hypothetical protein
MQTYTEHEFEAAPGLPEALPAGERILWQGSPDWKMLAAEAFHVRRLSLYFALMIALQAVMSWDSDLSLGANLSPLMLSATLAATALGLLTFTAWLSASTTMYTLTNKRVVMRIGIVLTLSFNLPLRWIQGAQIRPCGDAAGHGDIALDLKGDDRIAYLHLWPHARAWHVKKPQPTLRCLANAEQVGAQLHTAWQQRQAEIAASPNADAGERDLIPVRMPAGVYAR